MINPKDMNPLILKEEISRLNNLSSNKPQLGEADISFDSTFITGKVDTDIHYLGEFLKMPEGEDLDSNNSNSQVTWEIEPEMRSWGIKGMSVIIKNVVCGIEWWVYGERTREKSGVIEFNLTKPEFKGWNIENEMKFSEDGSVYPGNVSIDFSARTVVVS